MCVCVCVAGVRIDELEEERARLNRENRELERQLEDARRWVLGVHISFQQQQHQTLTKDFVHSKQI